MATEFQDRVYEAAKQIPRGRVTTYKELGGHIGCGSYRAVGTALGKNPFAPDVPCHRIVCSDGSLGGYSGDGGVNRKAVLLNNEGVIVKNLRVDRFDSVFYRFTNK